MTCAAPTLPQLTEHAMETVENSDATRSWRDVDVAMTIACAAETECRCSA